jgi:hypothetical protein
MSEAISGAEEPQDPRRGRGRNEDHHGLQQQLAVRDHSTSKARQVPGFSFGLGLARASFALIPAAMTAHSYRKQALLLGPGDDSLRQGSEKAIRELGRMAFRMNCRCFSGSVHPLLSRSDNARGRQQFLKMFAGSKRAAEHAMRPIRL